MSPLPFPSLLFPLEMRLRPPLLSLFRSFSLNSSTSSHLNRFLDGSLLQLRLLSTSSPSPSSSSPLDTSPLHVHFVHGLPTITVPLPSRRNEMCLFPLRPLSETVGILCDALKKEDRGIDMAAAYTNDGIRLSSSTTIEHLLQLRRFRLRVNDVLYTVEVDKPYGQDEGDESIRRLDSLRETISSLHASLCLDEYKEERERRIARALEDSEKELAPLEEEKNRIAVECDKQAERSMWLLFGAMGVQTGLFARLTWWEYSWDIMEPVTYFSTYLTVVASAAYYLHTKEPFEYPLAKNRLFTKAFHKKAVKSGFDVEKYVELSNRVNRLKEELSRIRDPLFHHLPIKNLQAFDDALLAERK